MKPPSGRIYERKIKLCKWQLAFETGGVTESSRRTAGVTFALISHLKNCGCVTRSQRECFGLYNQDASAFWQLTDPHFWWPSCSECGPESQELLSKLFRKLVATQEPVGDTEIPLQCLEHMTKWDWEGIWWANATRLLSWSQWNAQKSWSRGRLSLHADLHLCECLLCGGIKIRALFHHYYLWTWHFELWETSSTEPCVDPNEMTKTVLILLK